MSKKKPVKNGTGLWMRRLGYFLLLAYLLTFLWHQVKPMPEGTVASCNFHPVEANQIEFLYDLTYTGSTGVRINDQKIFDRIFSLIDKAENYVVLDFFLLNQFHGKSAYSYRHLSAELVDHLLQRKLDRPGLKVLLITDPINTIYGGRVSPLLTKLKQAGIDVVYTDIDRLRDSNPVYSSLWRVLFQWLGNDTKTGWLSNPFQEDGEKISLRSWLRLLNFKANHRKVIIADSANGQTHAVITSANPHDASSSHSNVAFHVQGNAAIALLESELAVAEFSATNPFVSVPVPAYTTLSSEQGGFEAACITEVEIRNRLLSWFEQTAEGDAVDVAAFYLADRKIVKSMIAASRRGVNIQIILDANKDAFGRQKNGIPNRSVANELVEQSDGRIQIRWFETQGEQFHSKIVVFRMNSADNPQVYATLGSANYTRRNIGNFNLEANLAVKMPAYSDLANELNNYFDKIWNNREGIYTVDYQQYIDDSMLHYFQYRFMEATGMSSF